MERQQIIDLVKQIGKSVRQIEIELGMPQSTLNKAWLGTRDLPEKWEQPLLQLANSSKDDVKNPTLSKTEEIEKEQDEDFNDMIDEHSALMEMLPLNDQEPEPEVIAPTLERQDKNIYDSTKSDFYLYDFVMDGTKPWIKEVEDFCADNNCTPQDIMAAFKKIKKPDTNWLSELDLEEG